MAASVAPVFTNRTASAAQITSRTLTLQAGVTDGGSKPGGVVNHRFDFTIPTTGNVGSIKFEYCTISAGTCTLPTGVVTTSATLAGQNGATGFTLNNTTNGAPYLTRTAASVTGPQAVNYTLAAVTNPTDTNYSFYVRISTYASTDTTGAATDNGAVTASTARQIVLTGIMPESIIFCAAETIGVNGGGIPDCSTATDGDIAFDKLFSTTDTAGATSQLAASTNAANGYVISVNGPTMTSGSNTIAALAAATASTEGIPQFGMNLKANSTAASTPAIGAEIAPASDDDDYRGQAIGGYATADVFKFVSGETIANSAYLTAGPTNSQIYTASYIVNVPGNQPAGTYTTTLTYICTATF